MGEKKNMHSKLESLASTLYESESEVFADQEKILCAIFDNNPDFAYLKEDSTLSMQVRSKSLQGLREGIDAFMSEKSIKDLCSVFDMHQHFSDFYYSEKICDAIEEKLKKDSLLRKKLCKTEALSIYECEHIADEVSSTYKDEIKKKILLLGGVTSLAAESYINMPKKPNKFDK